MWATLGVLAAMAMVCFDYRKLERYAYVAYVARPVAAARGAAGRLDQQRLAALARPRRLLRAAVGDDEARAHRRAGALLPPHHAARGPADSRPRDARAPVAAAGRAHPGAARPRHGRRVLLRGREHGRARRPERAHLRHPRRRRAVGAAGAAVLGRAPEAVPAEAHRDLPQPRARSARRRLPRHPVEDRDRLGRLLRQGLPARDAEPAALPPRAAHRLHLLGVLRGVGLRRRDRADLALPRR